MYVFECVRTPCALCPLATRKCPDCTSPVRTGGRLGARLRHNAYSSTSTRRQTALERRSWTTALPVNECHETLVSFLSVFLGSLCEVNSSHVMRSRAFGVSWRSSWQVPRTVVVCSIGVPCSLGWKTLLEFTPCTSSKRQRSSCRGSIASRRSSDGSTADADAETERVSQVAGGLGHAAHGQTGQVGATGRRLACTALRVRIS